MFLREDKLLTIINVCSVGLFVLLLAVVLVETEPMYFLVVLASLLVTAAIVKQPFIGLFLSVFFVQLSAIVDHFDPTGFALEALVALTIASVIFNMSKEIYHVFSSIVFRMACLFVLTATISCLFAEYPESAKFGIVQVVSLLVLFILILIIVRTPLQVKGLLVAIMMSTFISAGFANIGYVTGDLLFGIVNISESGSQAGAANISPTTSANLMLVGTAMSALLAFRLPKWRLLLSVIAITGIAGIIFTFARSATALIALGCVWLAIKFRKERHFPAVLMLSVLMGISIIPFIPDRLWDGFSSIGEAGEDWTLGRRVGYHVVGFDLMVQNPVFGVGVNNFREHYLDDDYRFVYGRQYEARALHNMYLSVAAETGLIGFSFFSVMILLSVVGLYQVRKKTHDPEMRVLAEAIQFGYVLYLIAAGSLPLMTNKYTWILTALAASVIMISQHSDRKSTRQQVSDIYS